MLLHSSRPGDQPKARGMNAAHSTYSFPANRQVQKLCRYSEKRKSGDFIRGLRS